MAKAGPNYATPDAITQVQRHYNPEEDVVGRAEYLPEHQFKVRPLCRASDGLCRPEIAQRPTAAVDRCRLCTSADVRRAYGA